MLPMGNFTHHSSNNSANTTSHHHHQQQHHHHHRRPISASGIRRGPGRPRLKPNGPGNQGFRITNLHHHAQHSGLKVKKTALPLTLRPAVQSVVNPAVASSSTVTQEPRPFGFYTQQQSTHSTNSSQPHD